MKRFLIMALLIVFAFSVTPYVEAYGMADPASGLPDDAREMTEDTDILTGQGAEKTLEKIAGTVKEKFSDIVRASVRHGAAALLAAVICALADMFYTKKEGIDAVSLAGVAAVGTCALSGVDSMMDIAIGTVDELVVFTNTLMPALSTAAATCGAVTSAAAKYSATVLFINGVSVIGKTVVVPLTGAYLAASAGSAVFGGTLDGAAKLIKKITVFVLSASATVFTLYITVTGTVTSAADAAAVKVTKAAVSGMLPVVGGIVSDASDAVVSGAALLKSGTGVFGLLGVCAVCAVPFLRLGVCSLAYKAAGSLAAVTARKNVADFINAVGTAVTLLLALTGTMAVMLFVAVICFMQAVGV